MPDKPNVPPLVQMSIVFGLFMGMESWFMSDRWTKSEHTEYSKTVQSEIDGLQRQIDDLKKFKCEHKHVEVLP